MLLAAQLKAQRHFQLHMIEDCIRNADATRLGQLFQPCRHVHSIAVPILSLDNDITDMHSNAHINAPVSREPVIAPRHFSLEGRRAFDRIHNASEFSQQTIAHQLENTPVALYDFRLEQLFPVRP
jgi:hypothetical protein